MVSVIIPAYNQGHYLGEAIQSVLSQTYQDFEVLVIDDGSTDNTAEIARSFSDPRIQYIYQDNRGLSGARNTGIRHARGEYLTYLDSDDQFLPEKLELLTPNLKPTLELGLVAGQAIPIDEHRPAGWKIFTTPLVPIQPSCCLVTPCTSAACSSGESGRRRPAFSMKTCAPMKTGICGCACCAWDARWAGSTGGLALPFSPRPDDPPRQPDDNRHLRGARQDLCRPAPPRELARPA
jgi:glycosyltransferase involved in cell wall biosynthesis